jgi:hypothetical protein
MSLNRRRHANVVPLASIATWVVVAAFAGTTGIYYVYYKNQLHTTGAAIKRLERDLEDLVRQNAVLKSKIGSDSSYPALQRRLEKGFIKLIPITDDRIVRVDAKPLPAQDELRAVSHERRGE